MVYILLLIGVFLIIIVYVSNRSRNLLNVEEREKFQRYIRPAEIFLCLVPFISMILFRLVNRRQLSFSLKEKYSNYIEIFVILSAILISLEILRRLNKYEFGILFKKQYMLVMWLTIFLVSVLLFVTNIFL